MKFLLTKTAVLTENFETTSIYSINYKKNILKLGRGNFKRYVRKLNVNKTFMILKNMLFVLYKYETKAETVQNAYAFVE